MEKCENCGKEFNASEKYKNKEHIYCSLCRKYQKPCEVCGKEIFVQARTCRKECAYELRKLSWLKSCGSTHNFGKKSTSRTEWETRLFEEEGIINVFQREDVKTKIRGTLSKNYGVEHALQSPEIMKIMRLKNEKNKLWVPLEKLSELELYRYNVSKITNESLRKYELQFLHTTQKDRLNHNLYHESKDRLTIDHKFSVQEGYLNNISPLIIGSIVNLEIMAQSKNSSKGKKCSITLSALMQKYKNFLENENKIN